jgi:hypothetical protein
MRSGEDQDACPRALTTTKWSANGLMQHGVQQLAGLDPHIALVFWVGSFRDSASARRCTCHPEYDNPLWLRRVSPIF